MSTLAEQYHPLRKFSLGDNKNLVIRLVLINVVIFAGLLFVKMVYKLTNAPDGSFVSQVIPWAVLPADPMEFLTHPWTLLTYMFVNTKFWLLLSCMIWFWGYGQLMQGVYGPRYILPLYILGGLVGALFFVGVYQLIPGLHQAMKGATSVSIGASACVTAVVICVTILMPKYRVFPMVAGGIPLYVITIIFFVFSFLGKQGELLDSYIAANMGGLLLGAYFGYRIKKGYTPGDFVNVFLYKFSHVFEPRDEKYTAENVAGRSNNPKSPFQHTGPVSENRIDEILDKINNSGIDSLSPEEKEILVKASKED